MKVLLLIVACVGILHCPARAAVGGGAVRHLVWYDPNPPGAVQRFNVYECPVMTASPAWEFIAGVSVTSYAISISAAQMFFMVTAVFADGTEVPTINTGARGGGSTTGQSLSTFTKLLPPKLHV
jgi:hypothetical protein